MVDEKGFDLALSALVILIQRFPQLRLIVAGDGKARPALERQVAESGLTSCVEFTGWVAPDKVPELLNTVTAVIMPSRREALGLVALEAALMERPVVGSRVGGIPEVIIHKETGLLFKKEDVIGLTEGITFLLEHPNMATRMGQAARRRALEQFSWRQYVAAYDTLYRKLAQGAANERETITL